MVKNIISLVLLIVSVSLNFKHAWDTAQYRTNPESLKMLTSLGINKPVVPVLVFLIITVSILLLIPKTFFLGNILNAMFIVLIMGLALRAHNLNMALAEIPF